MSTVHAERSENWFVRAAAFIGDLSNPFYREERRRDVWNEASAVALQILLWLNLLAATAVSWIVGADALPYVYGMLVMVGLAGWIAILYSWSLGVRVETSTTSRRRLVPLVLVAVLLAAGARAGDDGGLLRRRLEHGRRDGHRCRRRPGAARGAGPLRPATDAGRRRGLSSLRPGAGPN